MSISLKYIIGVIVALLLSWWSFYLLNPIEPYEGKLVEFHLAGWLSAPFLMRLYISIIYLVAVFLFLNINFKNLLKIGLSVIVLVGVYDFLSCLYLDNIILDSPMTKLRFIPSWITYSLFGLILVYWIVTLKSSYSKDIRYKWVKYIVFIVALCLPYAFNPLFLSQFKLVDNTSPKDIDLTLVDTDHVDDLKVGTKILALVSTDCPYCFKESRKIGIAQKNNPNLPDVYAFYYGYPEEVSSFQNTTNTSFKYSVTDSVMYFDISGPMLPVIVLLENGKEVNRWSDGGFNYAVMNNLSNIK